MKKIVLFAAALLVGGALHAQELGISTNVADYIAGGTLNMETSYGFARRWTVNAGVKYNPFSFGEGTDAWQLKQRSLSAGVRFWPWHIYSGWWLGTKLQYQEFSEGGISSPLTSEGDRYGAGLSGGYSRMLGKHFNVDFGIGLWGGYARYVTFACQTCGRRVDSGGKMFFRPNDIILGINYIF